MQDPITEPVNRGKARGHLIPLVSPQGLILSSPCLRVTASPILQD